ncbi:uncharacterized protein LOC110827674 isoform X2 [Zootermopsis nevadensis]|uniref:uncharacterized protein LOC110827674 isoform X2 n=1 Tax=Zootermopsis nevadensis TaxID=136037 RepID=UPI000B8E2E79|nr:uncharacterized protein LOC110827674 isoform X2 [Zootermopsis nevadensis]
MDISSAGIQCAGVILFFCGCMQAVTITSLPYRGFRLPRGTATFLEQDEGNRIRREMMAERATLGFYGGSDYDAHGYDKQNYDARRIYDDGNRYFGNEIDKDLYLEKRLRDYYPNYNPEGSSSNTRELYCDPRGRPYDNRGTSGYSSTSGGYNSRGGYEDRGRGAYNGGRGRAYEDRNRGYQPVYDRNRGGIAEQEDRLTGGRGYYSNRDAADNVGEGTVGFYGRNRRP